MKILFRYVVVNFPEVFKNVGGMLPDIYTVTDAKKAEKLAKKIIDEHKEDEGNDDDDDAPVVGLLEIYEDGSFNLTDISLL